jgi:hypothetical protein
MTDLQFYLKCRLKREPTLFPGCWQKARDSRAIKKKKKWTRNTCSSQSTSMQRVTLKHRKVKFFFQLTMNMLQLLAEETLQTSLKRQCTRKAASTLLVKWVQKQETKLAPNNLCYEKCQRKWFGLKQNLSGTSDLQEQRKPDMINVSKYKWLQFLFLLLCKIV